MIVGIDYRPVIAAPYSGIARQVMGMESVFSNLDNIKLLKFSPCSAKNKLRSAMQVPVLPCPENGLHRPVERFRFEYKFLPSAIKQQGVDVYIATANQGLPIWKKPKNIKSILLLHDVFQLKFKGDSHKSTLKKVVYRFIDYFSIRFSVSQADYIWVPSTYTKDEVINFFPSAEPKIRVLPNLVNPIGGKVETRDFYSFPVKYWLVVGTSEPRKNIPWFVESWKKARLNNPKIPDLVLVGSRMDLPTDIRDDVGMHFMTAIDDTTLHALYKYAELFWMPSYAEGFGLPVIEALAAGTPVATAKGSSLDEVTPQSALRFDPFDSNGLYELMLSATEGGADVDSGELKSWAERFSLVEYTKKLVEMFEEVRQC